MPRGKHTNPELWSICEWLPLFEVYRCGKMVLHDCKALSDFTSDCLGFKMKSGQIFVYGTELKLADYCDETAVITGNILRIELFGGRNVGGI